MCVYHVMCTWPLEAAGATGNDTTLPPFQRSAGILYPCSNTVPEYFSPAPTQCENTKYLGQLKLGENPIM